MLLADLCSITIGVAHVSIALALAYAPLRNKKLPGKEMYWFFALLLFWAGLGRLLDPWLGSDSPVYAVVIFVAACFSLPTAYLTWRAMPLMLAARPPEELSQANRRFKLLVESVQDYAIFALDTEGSIASWNVGAERIKGYKAEEIIGRHFSTFYTQVDRDRGHPQWELEQAKRDGRYAEEGWRVRKDGSTFWASVTITAVRAQDGRLEGFAKVTRDLTEKKLHEDDLEKLNKLLQMRMAALEAFNNSVCHDLNAPLRAMEGFTQALLEDFAEKVDPTMADYLSRVRAACVRMKNLVRDLLRLSQVSHEDLKANRVEFSMTDVAYEVVEQERTYEANRKHLVVIDPGMKAVGDPTLVRLLLQNLLSNAFKFAGNRAEPVVHVGVRDGEFFVSDNGIGFEPDKADRLFKPFSRLHAASDFPGTGIGLTICKRVTDIHDGNIRAEGRPGEGACFYFTLGPGDGNHKEQVEDNHAHH